MKYSLDSYGLYKDETTFAYTIRICVKMKEKVDLFVLRSAANKALKRYPYFAVKVRVDEDGAYVLEHNAAPLAVLPPKKTVRRLGSGEVNRHLCYIECEGRQIDFYISHSLAGGKGVFPWVMTTVYQYVCDFYHVAPDAPGILKPGDALLPGEDQAPALSDLLNEEPIYTYKSKGPVQMLGDYLNGMYNPFRRKPNYRLITIEQKDLLKVIKANDASVTAFILVAMAKTMDKLLPRNEKNRVIGGESPHNLRNSLPMPNTRYNTLSHVHIDYERDLLKKDLETLGTMTRGQIILQSDPSVSHAEFRRELALYEAMDKVKGLTQKRKLMKNGDSSTGKEASHGTYYVSYSGQVDWGEVADYVQSYAVVCEGHLLLELSAMADKVFVSIMQMIDTDKYANAFMETLRELGVPSTVEGPFPKRLTKHELPTR